MPMGYKPTDLCLNEGVLVLTGLPNGVISNSNFLWYKRLPECNNLKQPIILMSSSIPYLFTINRSIHRPNILYWLFKLQWKIFFNPPVSYLHFWVSLLKCGTFIYFVSWPKISKINKQQQQDVLVVSILVLMSGHMGCVYDITISTITNNVTESSY